MVKFIYAALKAGHRNQFKRDWFFCTDTEANRGIEVRDSWVSPCRS